jgi:hypothetical protein
MLGSKLKPSNQLGRLFAELCGAWNLKPYWGKPTVRNFRGGGWKRDHGSRTEAHVERRGTATGPYRARQCSTRQGTPSHESVEGKDGVGSYLFPAERHRGRPKWRANEATRMAWTSIVLGAGFLSLMSSIIRRCSGVVTRSFAEATAVETTLIVAPWKRAVGTVKRIIGDEAER